MAALLAWNAACSHTPPRAPVIGEAFAGPSTLTLRRDIPLQSAPVTTVKHGDRLEILRRHRTVFQVRAPNGMEGWVDQRQLLAALDMQNLKRLAQVAAQLPPQGAAVPRYGDLRVYTQPSLESPSFITVLDKEKVDVLGHERLPRKHIQRTPVLPPTPKKVAPPKKKKTSGIPPVPMPKPPPPPSDWQQLSKTDVDEPDEEADTTPTPTDDWSLIRTAVGSAGWALTRRIDMAIPDEVAQYAEGRRIVSYFPLGSVTDGDQVKNVWVWTTIGSGPPPSYDFDNFRVFIWSLRRHRYETSYIERNIAGFAPVLLEKVTFGGQQYPGFSICLEHRDGTRARREYALLSNIVRYAGERPCEAQPTLEQLLAAGPQPTANPQDAPTPETKLSPWERAKRRVHSLFHR